MPGVARTTRSTARVVAVLLIAAVVVPPLPFPAFAGTGLRVEGSATWVLREGDSAVRVSVEFTLTNLRPDDVDDDGAVTSYYFDTLRTGLPREATNVRGESAGEPINVSVVTSDPPDGRGPPLLSAVIALPQRLFYQQTQTVVLHFDLPGSPPRSDSRVRVNPAYAAFDARAWGDPGLASVQVLVDDSFEVATFGADLEPRHRDGRLVFEARDIAEPGTWFLHLSARNDDALDVAAADVDDLEVAILSWPGDVSWSDQVRALVEAGLPYLRERIGLSYDPVESVEILQARDPSLLGFAAWYLFDADRIELGEHVEPHVVLHELTHLWFNQRLFLDRWVNEGMAEAFAADAVAVLGLDPDPEHEPTPPDADDPGRIPLSRWVFPEIPPSRSEAVRARELYGYNASAWVITSIAAEIGIDGLAEVIAAASRNETAYPADGEPVERADDPRTDWRRLLDLFEERTGSTEAGDLFRDHVAAEDDLALLDERASARDLYRDLAVIRPAPWAVRRLMDAWDFAEAAKAMEVAFEVLAATESTSDLAAALGLQAPRASLLAYGRAATIDHLDAARQSAQLDLEAALVLTEARRAADAPRGFLASIGLIGVDVTGKLATAGSAFERSEVATAISEASAVLETIAGANDAGRVRLFWLGGGGLIVLGLTVTAAVVRRRGPS